MDLTKLLLDDFLVTSNLTCAPADGLPFESYVEALGSQVGKRWHTLGDGYHLHAMSGGTADVAVVKDGAIVGLYCGDLLVADPEHPNRGLGAMMVLAVAKHRSLPTKRKLSPKGKAALVRAWKIANGKSETDFDINGLL